MSTKPPTAVMMPSVSSSGFKPVLDLLQSVRISPQFVRAAVVRQRPQCVDLLRVAAARHCQGRAGSLELPANTLAHDLDVSLRQPALRSLFVYERPFGGQRPGLRNIGDIRSRTLGAA